jgi:hypothetical protein
MIISLSSIPSRFGHLRPTLDSLLRQKHRAERIILYIPQSYRRFPDWDGRLPIVPEGIEIHRVDEDFGPATKVLPAIREFAGKYVDILFCDDDIRYDARWSERFAAARRKHPDSCITEAGSDLADIDVRSRPKERLPRATHTPWTWRERLKATARHGRRLPRQFVVSGYVDTLRGFAGAMVRPAFFREVAFDIPDILWTVDDVWLSAHLEANGVPIWLNGDTPRHKSHGNRYITPLKKAVYKGHGRHEAGVACVKYCRQAYDIWPAGHQSP